MKKKINVTVCELKSNSSDFFLDWEKLVAHVHSQHSDLVLLPEMGLYTWFARTRPYDEIIWNAAVEAHQSWLPRLAELAPATVLGTRPAWINGKRQNQAFAWDDETGLQLAHTKYYLPDEDDFWEASWYERGDGRFDVLATRAALIGFMICTEMWFFGQGRDYGKAGAHIIATPRCTPVETLDKWLAGGRASAVVSGAYSLSSNHGDERFGGLGWVIDPDGKVLATTSPGQPFMTVEIDLDLAERSKQTYPRYVLD